MSGLAEPAGEFRDCKAEGFVIDDVYKEEQRPRRGTGLRIYCYNHVWVPHTQGWTHSGPSLLPQHPRSSVTQKRRPARLKAARGTEWPTETVAFSPGS